VLKPVSYFFAVEPCLTKELGGEVIFVLKIRHQLIADEAVSEYDWFNVIHQEDEYENN